MKFFATVAVTITALLTGHVSALPQLAPGQSLGLALGWKFRV